jgi:HAD superfamily hydrolase (TIGR01509 family)
MTFRGLIFDFNGVLWWDSHLQRAAWTAFAAQVRGSSLSDEELELHVHGRPNAYTLAYLLGRELAQDEVDDHSEAKEVIYRTLCRAEGDSFSISPGAATLLDSLAARSIPHTIATSSGQANVDFFFQHLGLDRWFDPALVVCDDGQMPGKPAPDIYLRAAQVLGLAPGDCVVVEDSISGIRAARAAGIGWVVALCPAPDQERLARLAAPDELLERLDHLDRRLFATP